MDDRLHLKLGIFLNDKGINKLDFRHPELGNPGVGGTLFCFLLLIQNAGNYFQDTEITVFHYNNNILPEHVREELIDGPSSCLQIAKKLGIQLLIHEQIRSIDNWFEEVNKYQINCILWAHNYLFLEELRKIEFCKYVKRVVFVGKEQYEAYIDDSIMSKADYVFNMCLTETKKSLHLAREKRVTYMGSLVKIKGFHLLAKEWKKIIKAVPEANLEVIGSGKLYNREEKLGHLGVASETYEKEFTRYLCDANGELLPSVHFHGLLGDEKRKVLEKTSIGVVNPSAKSETFCLCAVEMEEFAIPVVTKAKYGLLDTNENKRTGLLFRNRRGMRKNIIFLLNNELYREQLGENAVKYARKKFSNIQIMNDWRKVLLEIQNGKDAQYKRPSNNWLNDYKFIKLINRNVKTIPFLSNIPSVCRMERETKYWIGKHFHIEKFMDV